MDENEQLARLLAKMFIQRKDVKAVQHKDGGYRPDRTPWTMKDLRAHVAGEKTFGHYISDQDSNVKLFSFDVDLTTTGVWIERPPLDLIPADASGDAILAAATIKHDCNPREAWLDRRHPGRDWFKFQLRTMGEMLSSAIHHVLDIPVACAYSGNKGIHVYGFTGEVEAKYAREFALMALEYAGTSYSSTGSFVAAHGKNFYEYRDSNPENDPDIYGFGNLSIELFPKQDSMDGKDLGNLMRLPLGRNLKNPKDPTFFLDQTTALTQLTPHANPVKLLNSGVPWEDM